MGRDSRSPAALSIGLARLHEAQGARPSVSAGFRHWPSLRGAHVKKLVLLALIGVGVLAVWRKVQADRAELDLWTEATTSDN